MIRTYYNIGNKLLALPRYVWKEGKILTIKELENSLEIAEKLEKGIVAYSECFGRSVPLLSNEDFEKVYDPRAGPFRVQGKVEVAAKELIEAIRKEVGVEEVGVTGGLLVGKDTEDIDLVVYGIENCEKVYEILKEEDLLKRYSYSEALELLNKRGQKVITEELIRREIQKKLQGKFKGIDVYVRLVPVLPEFPIQCKRRVFKVGRAWRFVEIVDASMGHLYPCSYTSVDIATGEKIEIISDRGRYCELLEKGDRAYVEGEMEFIEENGERKAAINLWRWDHYLIPTRMIWWER